MLGSSCKHSPFESGDKQCAMSVNNLPKARVVFTHIAHFHKNIGKMPHNDGYGNRHNFWAIVIFLYKCFS
jgi:hypothetical protein